jgi:hypothetical protein
MGLNAQRKQFVASFGRQGEKEKLDREEAEAAKKRMKYVTEHRPAAQVPRKLKS